MQVVLIEKKIIPLKIVRNSETYHFSEIFCSFFSSSMLIVSLRKLSLKISHGKFYWEFIVTFCCQKKSLTFGRIVVRGTFLEE